MMLLAPMLLLASPSWAAGGAAPKVEAKASTTEDAAPSAEEAPADAGAAEEPPADAGAKAADKEALAAGKLGPSLGTHLVFLEFGFRQDLGTFSRREVVGANVQTQQDDVDTFGPMFHIGFLERVANRVRVGGAFAYAGNYNYEGNNLLGQMLTLDMRVEYGINVSKKWGFIATPRFGMSLLIPGGELADRINELQLAGFDTWSGPRYGFLAGIDAGARFGLTDWLSARATIGYAWFIMLLLNSHASDGTISAAQSWTLQASRLSGNLGLEVTF